MTQPEPNQHSRNARMTSSRTLACCFLLLSIVALLVLTQSVAVMDAEAQWHSSEPDYTGWCHCECSVSFQKTWEGKLCANVHGSAARDLAYQSAEAAGKGHSTCSCSCTGGPCGKTLERQQREIERREAEQREAEQREDREREEASRRATEEESRWGSRFARTEAGVLRDVQTGVDWLASPSTDYWRRGVTAASYCESLPVTDAGSWRLPTEGQLQSVWQTDGGFPSVLRLNLARLWSLSPQGTYLACARSQGTLECAPAEEMNGVGTTCVRVAATK